MGELGSCGYISCGHEFTHRANEARKIRKLSRKEHKKWAVFGGTANTGSGPVFLWRFDHTKAASSGKDPRLSLQSTVETGSFLKQNLMHP